MGDSFSSIDMDWDLLRQVVREDKLKSKKDKVTISRKRYEELLEIEAKYKDLCK